MYPLLQCIPAKISNRFLQFSKVPSVYDFVVNTYQIFSCRNTETLHNCRLMFTEKRFRCFVLETRGATRKNGMEIGQIIVHAGTLFPHNRKMKWTWSWHMMENFGSVHVFVTMAYFFLAGGLKFLVCLERVFTIFVKNSCSGKISL